MSKITSLHHPFRSLQHSWQILFCYRSYWAIHQIIHPSHKTHGSYVILLLTLLSLSYSSFYAIQIMMRSSLNSLTKTLSTVLMESCNTFLLLTNLVEGVSTADLWWMGVIAVGWLSFFLLGPILYILIWSQDHLLDIR